MSLTWVPSCMKNMNSEMPNSHTAQVHGKGEKEQSLQCIPHPPGQGLPTHHAETGQNCPQWPHCLFTLALSLYQSVFFFFLILPQWAFVLELWWHQGRTKARFSFLTLRYDENGKLVSSSQMVTLTKGLRKK